MHKNSFTPAFTYSLTLSNRDHNEVLTSYVKALAKFRNYSLLPGLRELAKSGKSTSIPMATHTQQPTSPDDSCELCIRWNF
jgi:hypothetical protein